MNILPLVNTPAPSQPRLVPAAAGKSFNLLGTTNVAKLTAADTGGAYLLTEQTTPPGVGVPPHVHTREDELFLVLEGEYEFVIDGRPVIARAGDILHAPRHIPHGYRAIGDRPARMQFLAMPAGIEELFIELGALAAPPSPAELGAISARFGITFLPPPPAQTEA